MKYRINFNYDNENDMTLVIKTDLSIQEVQQKLDELKQYLDDNVMSDEWGYGTDIEYYHKKMKELFDIEDENIDDFINFNY